MRGSEIEKELVTPTGAVLLTSLCVAFGPIPAMTLTGQGYGAGGRDLPIPNVLRVLLGEQTAGRARPPESRAWYCSKPTWMITAPRSMAT